MTHSNSRALPSRERLDGLFRVAPDLVAAIEADGRLLALSPRWSATPAPHHLHDLIAERDRDALDAALARAAHEPEAGFRAHAAAGGAELAWRIVEAGPQAWYVAAAAAGPEAPRRAGGPTAVDGGRHRDPPAAVLGELGDLAEDMPAALYRYRRAPGGRRRLIWANERLHRLGAPDGEPTPPDLEAFVERVLEPDRAPLRAALQASEEQLAPLRHEFRIAAGAGRRWLELHAQPRRADDDGVVVHGMILDVTDRRPTEALYLNAVVESTPDCVAVIDRAGRIVYLNAGGCRLLGLHTPNAARGRPFSEFVGPDDSAQIRSTAIPTALRRGTWEGEGMVVTGQGAAPVAQTLLCHRNASGRVAHFSAIVRDLSERVAAKRRLSASEERFRRLYQRTPIMLHSLDRDGNVVAVSDYWLKHLGYTRDEVIGRHTTEFIPEAMRGVRDEVVAALARHGQCKDVPSQLVRKSGEVRDVLVSAEAEVDARGRLLRSRSVLIDVTEQRRAETSYRDIFENITEGVYRSSADGRLLRVNPALARMHGFETEEEVLASIGDVAVDWYANPGDRDRIRELIARDGRVEDFEAEIYRRATGERIWTSENARAVYDASGGLAYYEGTVRDITAQYKARQLATRRGEILEMIARDAPLTGTLYEIVSAIEHHWGCLTAAVFRLHDGRLHATAAPGLSNACIRAVDGALPSELAHTIGLALRQGHHTRISTGTHEDTDFVRALRTTGYGEVTIAPVRDQRGAALGLLAAFARRPASEPDTLSEFLHEMGQIVSIAMEQHRLAQELLHQAQYDALTELPNRALLSDRLELAIGEARRSARAVAVLLLDLDDFKLVNDTLGHSAGDELLRIVADRLRRCLRPGDTVGRLGGDEFVLILPVSGQTEAADVARRVLDRLQGSVRAGGRDVAAHPSIGIGVYPQDGDTPESLLQAADTAMYAAKHAGKNRVRYFTEAMNEEMSERLRVETELRSALRCEELVLHYQPRVTLSDGRIVGAEALLRWHHPQRGLLAPPEFLSVAERGPLIGEIDRRVMRQAVQRAAIWQRAGRSLVLAANLSTHELHADGFGAELARILDDAGIDPTGLELEITESMLMHDFERASRQLAELKERAPGVRIALDDFGSGYSSLNYLRHLPLDTLKIDRSFIADLGAPGSAATAGAIAKTIVELGSNLGLAVVAEGVERERQADLLRGFGCHEAQGFWFDPALPIATFETRLGKF